MPVFKSDFKFPLIPFADMNAIEGGGTESGRVS